MFDFVRKKSRTRRVRPCKSVGLLLDYVARQADLQRVGRRVVVNVQRCCSHAKIVCEEEDRNQTTLAGAQRRRAEVDKEVVIPV